MRLRSFITVLWCLLVAGSAFAQAPFPVGLDGELYLAPRIDLVPPTDGGPYKVTLDGILDEPFWKRASFHTVNTNLVNPGEIPINLDPPELDWQMIFACVADKDYLYVAWKVADDPPPNAPIVTGEQSGCTVWQDDSIEIYIDALNNGPSCATATTSCYAADDIQLTIGADQIGKATPEELVFGGVGAAGACDFTAPAPEVMLGMVQELQEADLGNGFAVGRTGWQAEVAIPLTTNGNGDDGTPSWTIDPSPGTCIGFAMQGNDDDRADTNGDEVVDENDDAGGSRDHKLTWAKREADESAWRNPGVFGKLSFIDPTKPAGIGACALPVDHLTCKRQPDHTVLVQWNNPGTANPTIETKVFVDDVQKTTVPGDAKTVTLSLADVPEDGVDHVISVKNNSDEAATKCILAQSSFDACGGIRFWNMVGPYVQPAVADEPDAGCCVSPDHMRRDYLTDADGTNTELTLEWQAGVQVHTDFGNASPSVRILKGFGDSPAKNPGGVPTVFEYRNIEGAIDFRQVFRNAFTGVMVYCETYVINNSGGDLEVYMGISSDDSVQVILNGEEAWLNSVGRGSNDACTPQDVTPDGVNYLSPFILFEGSNTLVVKIFQGEGDWKFALRMQDESGQPVTEGLSISLLPPTTPRKETNCADGKDDDGDSAIDCADSDCAGDPACPVKPTFHRGDADDNGELQLTDAIRILGFLFLGGPAPACLDAADADDNNELQLTDAIRILGFLFLGGPAPVSPGPPPEACGPDPGGELGCASYTHC